jgi:tricorn protease
VAYIGDFDALYTIPMRGGAPFRVTHHPGATDLCDWVSSRSLLFMTDAFSHLFDGDGQARVRQLFTVSPGGGLPTRLPLPYGANGSISEDGEWLAFTLYAEGRSEHRANNRAGNAPDIWLFNLRTGESKRITDWAGTDTAPMWHGRTVYYLSDAGPEGRLNIWSYALPTGERRQLTRFADFDVKWPSMGPGVHGAGEIVFSQGTALLLLDLKTSSTRVLEVSLAPAVTEPELATVDAAKFVQKAAPSPDGSKAVLEARGDIWIASGDKREQRNLTKTSGVAERDPRFSPDGRWIAYFSDASGEYELYVAPVDGPGLPLRLSAQGLGYKYGPTWSPDSKRIAFSDSTGAFYVATMEPGETIRFDRDPLVRQSHLAWSPDSAWIAYARGAEGSRRSTAIWIYDVGAAKTHQVTSGWFSDVSPTFDRVGEYLYFVRPANPDALLFDSVDVNNFIYPAADVVLAVPLRRGIGSPWLPRSDDPILHGPVAHVGIELEGFEERAVVIAREPGGYSELHVVASDALIYAFKTPAGKTSIRLLDFRDGRSKKTQTAGTVLETADGFSCSSDGRKLLVRSGDETGFVDAAAGQTLGARLALGGMDVRPDPRAEWRQVFVDAWRMYRDFFYDPSMRGVDWTAARKKYEPLLDACASRSDVELVIGDMAGELGSSHVFVWSPSAGGPPAENTGMLGVDFSLEQGAYRIAKIYDGGVSDAFARSPLRRAGLTVAEGEYVLAVNGAPLDPTQDPWAAFKGLAGRPVSLTVGPHPTLDTAARTVAVIPRGSEGVLRNRAWVEANRVRVDRVTDGRVGYVYLANTHDYGSSEFTRQLAGQLDKEGLIVDERWNEGGYAPFHFVDVLARKRYMYFHERRRAAGGGRTPDYLHEGPTCMLINQISYSGGDQLPYYFRARGVGKLVGTRTLGGLVGAGINPGLIDGGGALVPFVAFYASSDDWAVEGKGVEPDVEVIDDPTALARGEDPQLDEAIRLLQLELRGNLRVPVPAPPGTKP